MVIKCVYLCFIYYMFNAIAMHNVGYVEKGSRTILGR